MTFRRDLREGVKIGAREAWAIPLFRVGCWASVVIWFLNLLLYLTVERYR